MNKRRPVLRWSLTATTLLLACVWLWSGWTLVTIGLSSEFSASIFHGSIDVTRWTPAVDRRSQIRTAAAPTTDWRWEFVHEKYPVTMSGTSWTVERWRAPLGLIPIACAIVAGWLWRTHLRARRAASASPCGACGYSLTGLTPGSPCPECGKRGRDKAKP